MTRIVVSEFVSLDGVMEEPRWTFDFERGPAGDQFKIDELTGSSTAGDGVLMLTYIPAPAAR